MAICSLNHFACSPSLPKVTTLPWPLFTFLCLVSARPIHNMFIEIISTTSLLVQRWPEQSYRAHYPLPHPECKLPKTPNMSFGSFGVDWVRSMRKKIQLQAFWRIGVCRACPIRNANMRIPPKMIFGSSKINGVRSL